MIYLSRKEMIRALVLLAVAFFDAVLIALILRLF
jgi:hypothetical protein